MIVSIYKFMMKTKPVRIKRYAVGASGRRVARPSRPLHLSLLGTSEIVNEQTEQIIIPEEQHQPPRPKSPPVSKHRASKQETVKKWAKWRDQAVLTHVENQGIHDRAVCDFCTYSYNDQSFDAYSKRRARCVECYQYNICSACAIKMHEYIPFHSVQVWSDIEQGFKPLDYNRLIKNTTREDCIYGTGNLMSEEIEVITDSGNIYTCTFEFKYCPCHPLMAQLTESKLWPASPTQPKMAFSFGFMKILNYLMLEGHMSLLAACQTFMWTNGWTSKKCTSIYKKLNNECFEEFRHFLFRTDNLIREISDCPACLKNGRVFYSLDGNFGLVRKKNSGCSEDQPKHATKLFLNDVKVSDYVEDYGSHTKSTDAGECSTFQAGDNNRGKNKAKGLDQTGVFGCICRHGIPKLFLNMKHGERFAYPVYLLQQLMKRIPDTAEPVIIYDIACKLKAHLQNKDDEEAISLLERIDMAVPCWHAYGHGLHCQMANSTHWKRDCGFTDGEEMERLWAYLRKFSSISKEMTPSHRIDLLTDGLLHYTKRKILDIGSSLVHRESKAVEEEKLAQVELDQLIMETNKAGFNRETIERWQVDIASDTSGLHRRHKRARVDASDWKEDYVENLHMYKTLSEEICVCANDPQRSTALNREATRIEVKLSQTEKEHKISTRWTVSDEEFKRAQSSLECKRKRKILSRMKTAAEEYQFHKSQRKKYADGQKQATKINKQLSKCAKAIRNIVASYNNAEFISDDTFPSSVIYENVVDPKAAIYSGLDEDGNGSYIVPPDVKRRGMQLLNRQMRASEEQDIARQEMRSYIETIHGQIQSIESRLHKQEVNTPYDVGLRAMLRKELEELDEKHTETQELFQMYEYDGQLPEDGPMYNSGSELESDSDDPDGILCESDNGS